MKILYAIQGTGNGHLSRARDIIPYLQKNNELDLLVSGTQADIDLPYPVTYQLKGLSFIFGKKGGVDMWKTYLKTNSHRLQKEVKSLPIHKYDLVINDFEPVSAWACKIRDRACIALSHQAAVLLPEVPQPKKKDAFGHFILKNYAPTSKQYGFHFKGYQDNIFTPVIRQDIRKAPISNGDHYTVYLPSYSDDKILKVLSRLKGVKWEVFSKHHRKAIVHRDITIRPITNDAFISSMASSRGILCGAGFETPAEALFMGKKLLVIPMKGQYEQQCNAAALAQMGVPTLKALKGKFTEDIREWVDSGSKVEIQYPDLTAAIIAQLLEECV
tara:strand:+ start:15087 stop:16073 length:987 start_codon:yes stop_codon:yes gene_type:complete